MAKFIVEIREDMNDLYACGVSNPTVEDLSLFIRVGSDECVGFIPEEALTVKRID